MATAKRVPVTRTDPAGVSTVNGLFASLVTAKNACPADMWTRRSLLPRAMLMRVRAERSIRVPSASASELRRAAAVATSRGAAGVSAAGRSNTTSATAAAAKPPTAQPAQ